MYANNVRRVARSILILAAIAAVMYLGCCAALFALQRSMIYSPQSKYSNDAGMTFPLIVDGARLVVSSRTEPGSSAVIYFGGNAEDVSDSMPTLQRAFPDRSVFALHYRGYNGSTGKPSETALIADALVLFDRIHATYPRVILIGRSLGSGIAIHVASMRPVERLVLVTPYDSLQEIAAQRFPPNPQCYPYPDSRLDSAASQIASIGFRRLEFHFSGGKIGRGNFDSGRQSADGLALGVELTQFKPLFPAP